MMFCKTCKTMMNMLVMYSLLERRANTNPISRVDQVALHIALILIIALQSIVSTDFLSVGLPSV